ncbi:hypothetical protein LCGC14_1528280 [marine sediment metagenome]|uniref:4Fe4S-binding SPASM domain-containing protein n=1 Tax=marine sediment metagenome TaxID=412755 RepID=A0A0F9JHJ8_9ZZZZ
MHMQIEFTNHCQLSCVECPHRFLQRKKQHMSDEVFEVLLEKYIISMAPRTVICHKDGEPLMHPKILEYMQRIDDHIKTKMDLYTNGLLFKPEMLDVFSGLRSKVWILVSFHWFNADGSRVNYEKVNERLKEGIKNCPSNVEFVMVSHVTDLIDLGDLREWQKWWLDFAQEHPAALRDVHVNTAINPWAGRIKQKNTIEFVGCPYSDGNHYFVGVTGNVTACCMDLEEEIIFDNIMTGDREIIAQKRNRFYERMRSGKRDQGVCKRCLTEPK